MADRYVFSDEAGNFDFWREEISNDHLFVVASRLGHQEEARKLPHGS